MCRKAGLAPAFFCVPEPALAGPLCHLGDGFLQRKGLSRPRGWGVGESVRAGVGSGLGIAMRRLLLGATTSLALGFAPAVAADLPARTFTKAPAMIATIYDWSGFYVGLNAGGASARTCWTNNVTFAGGAATNA